MKIMDYGGITAQLSKRRQNNIRLQDSRKAELYTSLPRVKEIDNELAHLNVQASKARIQHQEFDSASNSAKIASLKDERRTLMQSAGFPYDYIDPIYTCPLCKDRGYLPDGSSCNCLKQMAIDQLYEQSELDKVLTVENFDSFDLSLYADDKSSLEKHSYPARENASNILKSAKDFTENFKTTRPGILIYGETGTGKTFLTNCIAKSLLDKGYTVLYLSAIDLFDNILPDIIMRNSRDPQQRMLYDYIYNCDFLIIDDLGTEITNSFVQSQLFEIINRRTIRRQSTLISTNLDMKKISGRYTERVMSRIVDSYLIFNLYGKNIRYVKRIGRITGK